MFFQLPEQGIFSAVGMVFSNLFTKVQKYDIISKRI